MIIKNKEDWWSSFRQNKDNIRKMISYLYQRYDYWDGFPEGITFDDLDKMETNKDWQLLSKALNRIWFAMPERECREWAGWFSLCDLCSETWVFDEEGIL